MRFQDLADKGNQRLNDTVETQASGEPKMPSERPMKLIPWEDIWTSLSVAKIRGNGEMIDVFYDTLFREAIFDDEGAWSLDRKNHN